MWSGRNKPKRFRAPAGDGQDPRRASLRQPTETLSCLLGDVIDISATGVRIRCQGKPPFSTGAISTIKLTFKGGKLAVSVQERWRKRRYLRGYEIGLKFVNTSPNVTAAIESLVTFGFICPDSAAAERPKPKARPKLRVTVDLPDYYAALGVTPDADHEKVHAAYRRLARQHHPDINKEPGAESRFVGISEAYKVLSDPQQRRTYDLRQAG